MHWPLWWCVLCHWSSSGAGEGGRGGKGEGGDLKHALATMVVCTVSLVIQWSR